MATLQAACEAMATRFEVVLHGPDAIALRAAADAAFYEIRRLHAQLSLYEPSSEISFINARASEKAVKVEPRLFQLLKLARDLTTQTQGAFDITIGPLLRCWGFMGAGGAMPPPEALTVARLRVGMEHVLLDEQEFTIRFARPGLMLDLGSIGKGYALDAASEVLIEAGVQSALVHGGTSTVCAIGSPPGADAWKVAIRPPPPLQGAPSELEWASAQIEPAGPAGASPLAIVSLKDESLSVSAVHGKSFQFGGKTYGHIIDPRTGIPAQGALVAAVVLPSATESDALSTALLLGGVEAHEQLRQLRPHMRSLVAEQGGAPGQFRFAARGIEPLLGRPGTAGT